MGSAFKKQVILCRLEVGGAGCEHHARSPPCLVPPSPIDIHQRRLPEARLMRGPRPMACLTAGGDSHRGPVPSRTG